ncbi:DUF397 domain-containing protein [Streptomyces sp. NPDC004393]|uniref:DUF397 domain-containing protein n=1 Tax=Streptomyces sp. NPDC004533 TaxID=3154278 RepID=UPI0033B673BE
MHNTDDLVWKTSTYTNGNGACVEVAVLPDGGRAMRDTKDRDGGTQFYNRAEWDAFIKGAKEGQFDN